MLTSQLLEQWYLMWEEGERHDAVESERERKHLQISPATGKFLYQLSRSGNARSILEVGTSNGYSTLWLAMALHGRPGKVISLDVLPHKQRAAQARLEAQGLAQRVELVCGDAGDWMAQAEEASQDLIFLDADRRQYADWWSDIRRILRPGGLAVMDNALSHEHECADFIDRVLATEGYIAETYDIGKGQFVILKD